MENQKLQKNIMSFLKKSPIHMAEFSDALSEKFQIERPPERSIAYNLRLLEQKGLVEYNGKLNLGSHLRLTEKGHRSLDHWLKRLWRWTKKNLKEWGLIKLVSKLFLGITS